MSSFLKKRLAAFAPEHRFVLVATSALGHEDHPTSTGGDEIAAVLGFLGFEDGAVSARRVRDNFRQTNFDRLQVMRWLATGPDVDGDGLKDLAGSGRTLLWVAPSGQPVQTSTWPRTTKQRLCTRSSRARSWPSCTR